MEKRKFLFLYLNTGSGHKTPSVILSQKLKELYPDCEVQLSSIFKNASLGHFVIEKGYNVSLNVLRGSWPLIYDLGNFRWFQTLNLLMQIVPAKNIIRQIIRKYQPTDIVSVHFGLSPFTQDIIKKENSSIKMHVLVTDPFSVPKMWFYRKNLHYMVYSKDAYDAALACGVKPERVKIIPYPVRTDKFFHVDDAEKAALRKKLGFDEHKKMVLLAGGGEGLPGSSKILDLCIQKKSSFTVAVVCGRDVVKYQRYTLLKKMHPDFDLHVFGFVDNMDELVKCCDAAVIKSGASSLMEVIACRKPLIISKYLYGQEKGNMQYAVKKGVGFFIRDPKKILAKLEQIFSDENIEEQIAKNYEGLDLDMDSSKTIDYLMNPGW